MSIDQEKDPRETLYLDFKKRLEERHPDFFYDKNDLLDIYTYADDENDLFVMMEAVNLGRRLYPDDDELRLRRAIVLDLMGMCTEAFDSIADIEPSSAYSHLVKARLNPALIGPDRLEVVEYVVNNSETLDEDDIIQISEITRMSDARSWLADNLERIKAKAEYMPTLFYELAVNAIEDGDYQTAMAMVEELVDIEPMKVGFWEMYAEVAYNLSDYDKAENGADYALAIDEHSKRAAIIKGFVMIINGQVEQGREFLVKWYLDPEINSGHAACVLALSFMDDKERAAQVLIDYIDQNKPLTSREPLTTLASISQERAIPYIMDYLDNFMADDQDGIVEWSAEIAIGGAVKVAAAMLEIFETRNRAGGLTIQYYETLYLALYRAGLFDRIVDRFDSGGQTLTKLATAAWLTYVMSLARTGRNERVLKEIADIKRSITSMPLNDLIQVAAFEAEMRLSYLEVSLDRITSVLCAGDEKSLNDADPFLHIKSFMSSDD